MRMYLKTKGEENHKMNYLLLGMFAGVICITIAELVI